MCGGQINKQNSFQIVMSTLKETIRGLRCRVTVKSNFGDYFPLGQQGSFSKL